VQSLVIGITGGIGSGKSTVSNFLHSMGYSVYNSDERAKEMYLIPSIKKEVKVLLGEQAYNGDETINKKFIAEKIFNEKYLLEKLNNIIHPAVIKDLDNFKNKNIEQKYIFWESALLFELGLYKNNFKNILVTSPVELRIARVMQRDNISKTEVENKIKHQWEDSFKIKLADFVIENDGKDLILPKTIEWLDSFL
jgi:dephospho-CoA kinase